MLKFDEERVRNFFGAVKQDLIDLMTFDNSLAIEVSGEKTL